MNRVNQCKWQNELSTHHMMSEPVNSQGQKQHFKRIPSLGNSLASIKVLTIAFSLYLPGISNAYIWQNPGDGDWFNAENWIYIVPSYISPARIDNGGTANITNLAAEINILDIKDGGLNVDGSAATLATLSTTTIENGTVNITNGASTEFISLRVNPSEVGRLNILSGAQLTSRVVSLLGNSETASRTLVTVDGMGSTWTAERLSLEGNSQLNITNGGSVNSIDNIVTRTTTTATAAQIIVDGADSALSTTSAITLDGVNDRIDIINGAQVSANILNIRSRSGGNNIVNVTGNGSILNVTDSIEISNLGQNQLQIQGSGRVNSTTGIIGGNIDGIGTVLIDGNDSHWNTSVIQIGEGGRGLLFIDNGGLLVSDTAVLGVKNFELDSGQGSVNISGSGSAWQNSGTLIIGGAGTGEITLSDGGKLENGGLITIGQDPDTFGRLNIGSGSGETAQAAGLLSGPSGANSISFGDGDGAIVFNHTEDLYQFDANVTGSGAINISAGTTALTGDLSAFTGTTTIDDGLLIVNNAMTNAATMVNTGGSLGGTGSVGSVSLNGGAIAPGNSIGTLNVDGDINFSGGGIYEVEVNADGSSDKIIASGNALLSGGRVSVLPEPGDYAEFTQYSILEAGSLSGEFDSVSVDIPDFAFLDASLDYTTTEVALSLARNNASFSSAANTPNTISTANALTQASSAGFLSNITDNLLILDNQGAQRAFENLSGNQLSQASSLSLFANQRFNGLLNNRSHFLASNPGVAGNFVSAQSLQALAKLQNGNLSALSDLPATAAGQDFTGGSGFWLTPQAGFGDIDASRNARGTDFNYGGLAAGFDHWFDNNLLLGVSLGYSETRADDVDMDSFQGAVYGRWLLDNNRYLDGTVSLGRHQSDSQRLVALGNNFSQAKGDNDIDTRGMAIEFGQNFTLDNAVQLTPFVGIQYTHLNRDSFTETGAGDANLAVDDDRQESLRSLLGVKVARSFINQSGKQWDVDASLTWVHEFADNTANTNAAFAAAPAFGFKTAGPELNRDRAQIGLGVATKLSHNSSIRVGYQGEVASTDQDHSAYATFQFNW